MDYGKHSTCDSNRYPIMRLNEQKFLLDLYPASKNCVNIRHHKFHFLFGFAQ